ncbi:hypothetical protein C8R44DRAFT_877380 [Mycena epipterygia]|nr:hypothetical protein C8R44DRAFT_877380 [Mycena epipterygia]
MKRVGRNKGKKSTSTTLLATCVPTYQVNYHTGGVASQSEIHYVSGTASGSLLTPRKPVNNAPLAMPPLEDASLPFPNSTAAAGEDAGAVPMYEDTAPCDENGAKARQTVMHMDELKAQEGVIVEILLSLHYRSQLLAPCACGKDSRLRTVACSDCLQAELLCRQCWLDRHRTMPTHWALIWNAEERFFEKHDFCRVLKNTAVAIGHNGHRCPEADPMRTFTLVESNGIHATSITFCRCETPDGQRGEPEFQQLLRAGIFPGSVKEPKTGYTLGVLEYYRQLQSQGKGSAYNFVLVLQRMADPFFAGSVPDVYANFLTITRFHQHLDIIMRRGYAHGVDVPLPGETDRPYPNRPIGYLGLQCAACPERGVNMPLVVNVPRYLRHLISQQFTLDGNFKANLFFKRDNGSDKALTDGRMYFPRQTEYNMIANAYVVSEEDKDVPCKAHIGSIRHQGQGKYGNTAISGVVACACDHAMVGSFVDMKKGEAFALGTYAQREHLRHTNTPPHGPETATPTVFSYDSWCSFVVNVVNQAITLFPEEGWLHTLLAEAEAELLATERRDALRLFELHMAVVEDLSRQHATEVVGWSRLSRTSTTSADGTPRSVYQHESTEVVSIENMLASMRAEEREKSTRDEYEAKTSVAQWIRDGMFIERDQQFLIALLKCHREHPLQEMWTTITKQREALNADLKNFRERQRDIYPRLKLSALDLEESELTAIQLPSYRMKHGQRSATSASEEDSKLREAEIKLRCTEVQNGILAVQAASLALSAVKKARDLDYRGQAGVTRSQRNLQKAELMKTFEITMYNRARDALIHLGHVAKDSVEPYPPLTHRDTRRKETHLHRAKGDSRLFDGTAWYLQSGVTISRAAVASTLDPSKGEGDTEDDEPRLLAGTQTLKRSGFTKSSREPKRLKDIAPDNVVVESSEAEDSDTEMSPSKKAKRHGKQKQKQKQKKSDGWIWEWFEQVTRARYVGDNKKLVEYRRETTRVQWFRAEAEMYRWLEQYERKHAELMRVIERYRRDHMVWAALGDREEQRIGAVNGAATFARMQAAMYNRLEHNARVIFKSAESGAHHDWVTATTFDEMVTKIDKWRDAVFKWMDEMDIHRAYKDF